ncbi:neprilysin-1-like isoform X2 [Anthonomus grandis grandis]|uniref:neprilysin-1-like isoform X2 n=1 Tax=Anthonomus grandis grandis TaxID=2921223 RepID=UPI0021652C05|nr:neprilysin-1-like isoform X2 [Anthonomus grandis grandis]
MMILNSANILFVILVVWAVRASENYRELIGNPPLCKNFYGHACAPWKSRANKPDFEVTWSHFTAASYSLKSKIHQILVTPPRDDQPDLPLVRAQTFYNACVTYRGRELEYLTDLKALVKYFGGWPIAEERWSAAGYDWLRHSVEITKSLGVAPLVKFHAGVDYKDTNRYVLYVEPGNLVFPPNILVNLAQYPKALDAYEEWIYDTIKYMYPNVNLTSSVRRITKLERTLAKMALSNSKMERSTLGYFSEKFGVNFHDILAILLENIPNTIVVKNPNYLKKLIQLLTVTDKHVIANYLIWAIVKDFSRDTTNYLTKTNFLIDKKVLGYQKDISRPLECTNEALEHFAYALLPSYLRLYVKPDWFKSIELMWRNVKLEFMNLLLHNTWLGSKTKALAVEKVKKIEVMLGYFDWMANSSYLYNEMSIGGHHFKNLILLKEAKVKRNFLLIGQNVTGPHILQNTVFIPLGILQEPFYHEKGPSILNYATLGSLMGHELSHSLDATGRQAQANGKLIKWWNMKDVFNYQQRSKCFRYNSTDSLSVGENIADHVGLYVSYKAFKGSRQFKLEDVFKGPEDDRVFFLAYAQMWCEISDRQEEMFADEHAPVEARVNHAVLNNKYFIDLFKCDKNEPTYCRLW